MPDRMMALFADAVVAAHDDPAVGHLSGETQRLLADAYARARFIADAGEIDWGSYTDPTMDPRMTEAEPGAP